jgi:hypothetical protein
MKKATSDENNNNSEKQNSEVKAESPQSPLPNLPEEEDNNNDEGMSFDTGDQ